MKIFSSCVVFVLLATSASFSLASASQADLVAAKIQLFSSYLNSTSTSFLAKLNAATTTCSADDYKITCPASSSTSPNISWTPGGDIDPVADFVQVRPTGEESSIENSPAQVCALAGMRKTWKGAYATSSKSVWTQYAASTLGVFGRWPASSWDCAVEYKALERPWWVSGASGPRDIVIAMDFSNEDSDSTWRISSQKRMAISILKSLSFRDFVAVLMYTSSPRIIGQTTLVRGTPENIAFLVQRVTDAAAPAGTQGAGIGPALETANEILKEARQGDGSTSNCSSMIVLFSSGQSESLTPSLGTVMKKHPDNIVFTFWVFSNATGDEKRLADANLNARRIRLARLACASGGLALQVPNSAAEDNVTRISDYLAALGPPNVVRTSEAYDDAFSKQKVVSFSSPAIANDPVSGVPLLAGIVAFDVALTALKPSNMSADEFNSILMSSGTCFRIDRKQVMETQSGSVALMQGDNQCNNLEPPEYEAPWRSWYGGVVTASVLGTIACFCLPGVLFIWKPDEKGIFELLIASLVGGGISFCLFLLIFLSVFWAMVFPDIIVREYWIKTTFVVEQPPKENPYKCCRKTCGGCGTASATAPTCDSALSSKTAGPCRDGYRCCRRVTYSCNCRQVQRCRQSCSSYSRAAAALGDAPSEKPPLPPSRHARAQGYRSSSYSSSSKKSSSSYSSRSTTRTCSTSCSYVTECDTCSRCVSSTPRLACTITCGTCYRPSALARGDYLGRPISKQFGTACGMGDRGCVSQFTSAYKVGSSHTYWLDPEAPESTEPRTSNELREAPKGAAIAMGVFAAIPLLAVWVIAIAACCVYFRKACCDPSSSSNTHQDRNNNNDEEDRKEPAGAATEMAAPLIAPTSDASGKSGGALTFDVVGPSGDSGGGAAMSPSSADGGGVDTSTINDLLPGPATGSPVYPAASPAGAGDNVPPPPGGYSFPAPSSAGNTGVAPLGASVDNTKVSNPFEL